VSDPEDSGLHRWAETLERRHGHTVRLTLTRNRRSMIHLRPVDRRRTDLRLHKAFGHAPRAVLDDLTRVVLRGDTAAWKRVAAFARHIPDVTPPPPPSPASPRPQGVYHDLRPILDEVRERYFTPDLEASITWGRHGRPLRRRRRSIRFASWDEDQKRIRVHPVLDADWVPKTFLRYLVHHELCHAVKPPVHTGRRRRVHHPDFRALESRYPDLEQMEALSSTLFARIRREGL